MSDYLRSVEGSARYRAYRECGELSRGCPLCDGEAIKEFRFWKVMQNRFPYDKIASTHHMLLPLQHTTDLELTNEERQELQTIKAGYVQEYDYMIEATVKT